MRMILVMKGGPLSNLLLDSSIKISRMHAAHRDTGMTPLHVAAQGSHVHIVQYLIEHGVFIKLFTKNLKVPIP